MPKTNHARRAAAEDDARLRAGRSTCAVRVTRVLQLVDATAEDDADAIVLPVAEADAVMGETVEAYLERVAWRLDLPTVCRINGEYYGRAEWATRAIGLNDNVEFVSRPMGGSSSSGSTGKSILAIVAMVALTAVAGPIGGFAAGAIGLTAGTAAFAITSSLIGALVVGAGSLLLSHFLKPKSGGKTNSTDALYSFGLQGNAARPMQPIPVLNGRLRFAPDFAAPSYSLYNGDEMTDYALFGLTCGEIDVEQILLGDTPIWSAATGYNPDYPGIEIQIVPPGEQVTLYPVNVVTADELQGAELTTEYTPGIIVNAAGTKAKELIFDFVWASGSYRTGDKGQTLAANTHILIRIRAVDDAGAPAGPWQEVFGKVYSQAKQSQIRITERFSVPAARYQVSVRRVNPPLSSNGQDAVSWTAARATIDGPQSFPRVSTLAVKGTGNKANSGVSGGQLRVIGTRKLPVWENGQWVVKPTRSIAWAALDWWRNANYSAGLDLANVDFAAFVAYDRLWASLGHTFDFRFTEVQTLDEVLETVLKAGRAFPAPIGDKLTITREEPRGLARMLFTDNDIVAGSLEIDYALADQAWADGIVGEYLDETSWRMAEVSSAPEGVVLTNPARVQLQGFVQRGQATGAVRFMAAESQYRRTTVSWTARMEGRLLKRGDLARISTSEPETWGSSHEIVATGNGGLNLRLDPAPQWTGASSHWLEIRQRDGRPFGPVRVTRGASDADLVLNSGDAASSASAASAQYGFPVSLADAVARDATEEAPWAAFSPGQPRAYPVLIKEGDPDEDGELIYLKGVLDAPEVYTTTETGVAPLPQVPDLFSSALPVILGLTASISQRQATLVLSAGWLPARNTATYEWGVSYDNGATWVNAAPTERTTVEAVVGASEAMLFRVRGRPPAGPPGGYSITQVIAPSLQIDGDLFKDVSIRIEKLSGQLQADIQSISDLGKGLLAIDEQTGDAALDFAHDTIRGGLTQVKKFFDLFADALATQTRADYEQRELIKVAVQGAYAAIAREEIARSSADEASAKVTTALGARLSTAEGSITATGTAVDSLTVKVTNQGGTITTLSQSLTSLEGRADSADLSLSGQATAIQGLSTRVTVNENGISTISQAVVALRSDIVDANGVIQANAQAISTLTTRADTIDGRTTAVAQQLDVLSTTVGGHTATITSLSGSYDGIRTQVGVVMEIDGTTGGYVMTGARSLDGSVNYQFSISGNLFVDGWITSRMLATQRLITTTAQIGELTVDSINVKDGAISGLVSAQSDGQSASVTIKVRTANAVSISFGRVGDIGKRYQNSANTGALRLYCDDNLVYALPGIFITDYDAGVKASYLRPAATSFTRQHTPGIGTHAYRIEDDNNISMGGVYINVQESK